MQGLINIYKSKGMTPLQAIEAYKHAHPALMDVKMTYAGRLDPMAEGVLPVLAGDDVHKKDEYTALDKQYEAKILLGVSSDTYDTLGIASAMNTKIPQSGVADELLRFKGSNLLRVPPYSSVIVKSQPLFYWARENKLNEIDIPTRTMMVHDVHVLDIHEIEAAEVLETIKSNISLVKGDFRQDEAIRSWESALSEKQQNMTIVHATFHVASGVYIRAIAHEFGQRLGCGAVLYSLKRNAVGPHTINDSIRAT